MERGWLLANFHGRDAAKQIQKASAREHREGIRSCHTGLDAQSGGILRSEVTHASSARQVAELDPSPSFVEIVPNLISLSRIPLGVALVVLAQKPSVPASLLAFSFLLAGYITDIIDGRLARRWHVESALGRSLDVGCDRVLHLGAFFFAAKCGAPLEWVLILAVRDILVTAVRVTASFHGTVTVRPYRNLSLLHAGILRTWFGTYVAIGALSVLSEMDIHGHAFVPAILNGLMIAATATGYVSLVLTIFKVSQERK